MADKPEDLVVMLTLANGSDDCTCNVAEHSPDPGEHDPYCAFPLMHHAATEVGRLRSLLRRYRTETPLGHQPHMIAHEVDAVLGDQQSQPQEKDHG